MTIIKAHQIDHVHYEIVCDHGVGRELSDYFAFRPDGYQWNPAFKNGYWDGYIRLYNEKTKRLYIGLRELLVKFAEERNYEIKFFKEETPNPVSYVDAEEFALSLNLHSDGKQITPHDYQLKAYHLAINDRRTLLISPTASGKSLIIYMICRYLLDHNLIDRVLLVVPTVGLVKQMFHDFNDYSSHNSWNADQNIHQISAGAEKNQIDKPIVISTWQSIFRMPKKWFEQFDCVFSDEAHTVKAKSLTTIMEALTHAHTRIGTTGTLDGSVVNRLMLTGLIGPIYKVVKTKELMDSGTISQLKVVMVQFEYTDEDRKLVSNMKYPEEIDFIINHPARQRALTNLATSCNGNTITLFQRIEHGKRIYQEIRNVLDKKKIPSYYIAGNVDPEQREQIRKAINGLKQSSSATSLGTFSTGINIKNLHNAIFAHPFKSIVLNFQSIGRILRKADNGQNAILFDIVDNLSWKKNENYALKHAQERMSGYLKEGFKIQCVTVKIART